MDIKIKISTDTLIALGKWFAMVNAIKTSKGEAKVWVSIGLGLSDKFENHCKKMQRQTALFDAKKKHSYKLKYYEAWAFKELLIVIVPHIQEENNLHFSLLTQLIHELDQKLL